jgi:hypothetical protein
LLVVALVVGSVLGLVAWFSVLVVALAVGSVLGIVAWFSVLVVALVVGSVVGILAWFSVWHVHQQLRWGADVGALVWVSPNYMGKTSWS